MRKHWLAILTLAVVIAAAWEIRRADGYPILDPGNGATAGSGYPGWGADTVGTIYTTSTTIGPLAPGLYAFTCGAKVWVDQGTSAVVATTSERRIPAEYVYPLKVNGETDTYIAYIGTSGGGNTCVASKDVYP